MLHLSPKALQEALAWRNREQDYHGKELRLYINGKGCDGFNYGVCFDYLDASKDAIFAVTKEISLGVDKESLPFVLGTTIEWVDDTRGRGFWVNNPEHNKFRGKFYKKENFDSWLNEQKQTIEGKL